jgi:hypothetical protein
MALLLTNVISLFARASSFATLVSQGVGSHQPFYTLKRGAKVLTAKTKAKNLFIYYKFTA